MCPHTVQYSITQEDETDVSVMSVLVFTVGQCEDGALIRTELLIQLVGLDRYIPVQNQPYEP